jgi:hypothetical protein
MKTNKRKRRKETYRNGKEKTEAWEIATDLKKTKPWIFFFLSLFDPEKSKLLLLNMLPCVKIILSPALIVNKFLFSIFIGQLMYMAIIVSLLHCCGHDGFYRGYDEDLLEIFFFYFDRLLRDTMRKSFY